MNFALTMARTNFSELEPLSESTGNRLMRGIMLYLGNTKWFGSGYTTLPISAL